MNDKEFLTVKEFAEAANVSTQYIYKILGSQLKPYKKQQNKKTVIDKAALKLFDDEVATDATKNTNHLQPSSDADLQPMQPTLQPTDATENFSYKQNGEVEALKQLVEELKQEKEELKKDKEYLKQEALKWQQLLIDERNKVKLLEAAVLPVEKETEYKEVKEPAFVSEPQEQEEEPQQKRSFWSRLFNK